MNFDVQSKMTLLEQLLVIWSISALCFPSSSSFLWCREGEGLVVYLNRHNRCLNKDSIPQLVLLFTVMQYRVLQGSINGIFIHQVASPHKYLCMDAWVSKALIPSTCACFFLHIHPVLSHGPLLSPTNTKHTPDTLSPAEKVSTNHPQLSLIHTQLLV